MKNDPSPASRSGSPNAATNAAASLRGAMARLNRFLFLALGVLYALWELRHFVRELRRAATTGGRSPEDD